VKTTVKAKIETIRIMEDGVTFTLLISFPEFKGPAGDAMAYTFHTTLQEYQDYVCPGGIPKTPAIYVEYRFARPTHAKLQAIHNAIGHLEGREYDW